MGLIASPTSIVAGVDGAIESIRLTYGVWRFFYGMLRIVSRPEVWPWLIAGLIVFVLWYYLRDRLADRWQRRKTPQSSEPRNPPD